MALHAAKQPGRFSRQVGGHSRKADSDGRWERGQMLIFDSWYMFAWAAELGEQPIGRTLLGEPVVVFRTEAGEVGALADACPHRAVALSKGHVAGNNIRCLYHALEFDVQGVCRHNPHAKGPPDRIKTRSYPVHVKDGIIWVWMGKADRADVGRIVDYSWMANKDQYATAYGYLKINADYRLMIDNLMDLAHAEYIHPDTVGTKGAADSQQSKIVKNGTTIAVQSVWADLAPNPVIKQFWSKSATVDQYSDMIWQSASNLFLDVSVTVPGMPRESGYHLPSAHILTPEGESTTHYFWSSARNFSVEDHDLTRIIGQLVQAAFETEDKPVLESAQKMIEQTHSKLVNLTIGDRGSLQVRQQIDRLVALENSNG